ncbi:MAG: iolJ [Firmicutes bacterium]|nr:iolJ [Bacillota bacterium]
MALVNLQEILKKHDGAVGAFSTYDLFTVQGVIQGAEEAGLPVIAMIGAPVLNQPGNDYIGEILVDLARRASVPVCIFLDHAKDYATCMKAIRLGFSTVMIDGSHLSIEENIAITNKVTEAAHSLGVSVEAEVGALAGLEDGEEVKAAKMTNPQHVAQFLAATSVDGLAVSIGNAHGLYKGKPNLNFDLLQEIAKNCEIPLILHGGTGLSREQFAKGISLGIKKINIGTEVKKVYMETFITTHEKNVSAWDMIAVPQACKNAVAAMVKRELEFFAAGWKTMC